MNDDLKVCKIDPKGKYVVQTDRQLTDAEIRGAREFFESPGAKFMILCGAKLIRVDEEEKSDLWIVGQYRAETQSGIVCDIQGVFDSKERAIAACRNERYFIAPIALNKELPDETVEMPGCYYPLQEAMNG
jgi:hypothetical protein